MYIQNMLDAVIKVQEMFEESLEVLLGPEAI